MTHQVAEFRVCENILETVLFHVPNISFRNVQTDTGREHPCGVYGQSVAAGPAASVDYPNPACQRFDEGVVLCPGDIRFDQPFLRKTAELLENRIQEGDHIRTDREYIFDTSRKNGNVKRNG